MRWYLLTVLKIVVTSTFSSRRFCLIICIPGSIALVLAGFPIAKLSAISSTVLTKLVHTIKYFPLIKWLDFIGFLPMNRKECIKVEVKNIVPFSFSSWYSTYFVV